MSDQVALVRQWLLLQRLCASRYGLAVADIAHDMNVSQKTIRRDLELFQSVGFPLEAITRDHGRKQWKLRESDNPLGVGFTLDEAIAIYLGRRFLEPLAGSFLGESVQKAYAKIRACLGENVLDFLKQFDGLFFQTQFGRDATACKAELFREIMRAIEESRVMALTYLPMSATEPVSYSAYPYGLVVNRGAWYLVAYSAERKAIRHYKVARIEKASVSEKKFSRPVGFNVREHLADSFGIFKGKDLVTVRVRFSPTVARYVEESQWHPSQKLKKDRDGGVTAEFRLSSTEEIRGWILSFGRHATVIEPRELREAILDEIRYSLIGYETKNLSSVKRTQI